MALEHDDGLPAASVATARMDDVVLLGTVTVMPGLASWSASPLPAGVPEQFDVRKSSTDEPASALPMTFGLLSDDGDVGEVDVSVGGEGDNESST
jgi:hypothetical protein